MTQLTCDPGGLVVDEVAQPKLLSYRGCRLVGTKGNKNSPMCGYSTKTVHMR